MLILIVEDNRALAGNMIEFLESEGFSCDYAERGDHGLELACSQNFAAIVLDIMLPGMDGLRVCQELRQRGNNTPILMLTARDTLEDKLEGFERGAEDYLVKPFDLPELAARIKVLARKPRSNTELIEVEDLVLDNEQHTLTRQGQAISLSPSCWKILEVLLHASPNVVSKAELERLLWQDQAPDSDALKSHLYQLRQKINKPFASDLIHTVRGVGMVLRAAE